MLAAATLALCAAAAPVTAQDAPGVASRSLVEADGTHTLVNEALIAAPPAAVWDAIASPEGWMRWAVPLARIDPTDPTMMETSYNKDEPVGGPGSIRQQFVLRVPQRLLAFRTVKAPEGFPHAETYYKVTSVFELEPAKIGTNDSTGIATRLRLTSVGFADTAAGRELLTFFTSGNAQTLESLRKALEQPAPSR